MSINILKQIDFVKISDQSLGLTPSGTIYKAIHANTSQPLIVKVVSKDRAAQDEKFLGNLKREYLLLQMLKSNNVFQYIEMIESPTSYYLVCDHTDGASLEEFINGQALLNEQTILKYFMQILNGYSEFFKLNTPHMNISASNIFYDIADKTLKLTPFFLPKNSPLKKHCNPLSSFMSPEFLMNPEIDFHYKNDMWSLGAVLFFITFKSLPFKGDNLKELLFNLDLLMKDVVANQMKSDNRKFSKDFIDFMEAFFHKIPGLRLDPIQMITHPCLVKQKDIYESVLTKQIQIVYDEKKQEGSKCPPELLNLIGSMAKSQEVLFKDKNLRTLEITKNNNLGQACNYIRLYNECSAIYLGNWIEKSTIPKLTPNSAALVKGTSTTPFTKPKMKMINRVATLGDIPIIDEEEDGDGEAHHKNPQMNFFQDHNAQKKKKKHVLQKAKTFQNMDHLLEPEADNLKLSESEALKVIIPKYYNELDFYNFLYENFLGLQEMEKDFKDDILLVRFALIKYIIFRFQMFEKKVMEKVNIFSLPLWAEKLQNTKEYGKIMEIVPQKQEKTKWNEIYLDLGEETDKLMDDFYKKGELRGFSAAEKHFLERESLLHVIMFYANDFQEAFHHIIMKLLKSIKIKDEEMKKINQKLNPKVFKVGLNLLKILEINQIVGLDKFDKKMKHSFKEIRNSMGELNCEMIENLFKQGSEGCFKAKKLKKK